MKVLRLLLLIATATLFPFAALAQTTTVQFTNNDGTFTFDENPGDATYDTLSLGQISGVHGSTPFTIGDSGLLTAISGLSAYMIPNNGVIYNPGPPPSCTPGCLGSISLTTGTIATGNILTGATFNPGGTFMVSYNAGAGQVVSFSGTFSTSSWSLLSKNTWQFNGTITNGTLDINGSMYLIPETATVQLTTTGAGATTHPNKGVVTFQDNGGTTNGTFTVAPEPGTLTLFGSGLIAVGMFTRRRLQRRA